MAITFFPKPGDILLCDFSTGFKEPEMVKSNRPVLVLSPCIQGRAGLATVAALSTVAPEPVCSYHYKIPRKSLPQTGNFQERDTWLKGDMIYSVGFHRLNRIKLGKRDRVTGKRMYFCNRLGREQMKIVYECVLCGLGLWHVSDYL